MNNSVIIAIFNEFLSYILNKNKFLNKLISFTFFKIFSELFIPTTSLRPITDFFSNPLTFLPKKVLKKRFQHFF